MDRLDPARTALVVVHMAKGVAGDVDTPFNRLFRQSQRVTMASSKASRMLANRLAASMPGWISSMAACASARIRPDHSGRVQPLLGDAQKGVGERDGDEHARVEYCRIARHVRRHPPDERLACVLSSGLPRSPRACRRRCPPPRRLRSSGPGRRGGPRVGAWYRRAGR